MDGNPDLAALSAQNGRTEISEATAPNGFLGDGSSGGLNLFDVGVAGDTISFKVKISDIQLTYPHGGETWICGVPVFRRPCGSCNSFRRAASETEGGSPIRPPV